jgi:thioredoxin-related protein
MRKIVFYLMTCWMAGNLMAAEGTWLTSVPDALTQARKEKKLVLLDFTGSDWCSACKRLDEEVFSKSEFQGFAKTNLVLVELDFPSSKPQSDALKAANNALQEKYQINGLPTLVVLNAEGKVVWEQEGYLPGGPSVMIDKLKEVKKK